MSNEERLVNVVSGMGSHYSVNCAKDGMKLLRSIFPDGEADEMNFVLFSTSGVHGTYQTIEEEEADPGIGVTFLVVHPRLVTVQYGNAYPQSKSDYDFLKQLRASSKDVVANVIGSHSPDELVK